MLKLRPLHTARSSHGGASTQRSPKMFSHDPSCELVVAKSGWWCVNPPRCTCRQTERQIVVTSPSIPISPIAPLPPQTDQSGDLARRVAKLEEEIEALRNKMFN